MSTDEYGKGLQRAEQIQFMRACYGQHSGRRHFYDLGVANIRRLNVAFRAHSDEYWRGYADGLSTTTGTVPGAPVTP